jgi:diguanylate cyclase (GGDEF)-like protein
VKHVSLANVGATPVPTSINGGLASAIPGLGSDLLQVAWAAFLSTTADHVIVIDASGAIIAANTNALDAPHKGDVLSIGGGWEQAWPIEHRRKVLAAMRSAADTGRARFAAYTLTESGEQCHWDVALTKIHLATHASHHLMASARKIEVRQADTKDRGPQELVDGLTGLPNAVAFHNELSARTSDVARGEPGFAVVTLNLDGFEQLNSRQGPQKCDRMLAQFADLVTRAAGSSSFFARSDGDEFALIIDAAGCAQSTRTMAARMISECANKVCASNPAANFSVSAGIALFPTDATTDQELLLFAQTALHAAKAKGRGGECRSFDGDMRQELQRHSAMLELARGAIARDRIRPYYQPKVDLQSGQMIGLEALLRWESSGGAVHSPATISAAFDDNEIAHNISDMMLRKVVADVAHWQQAGSALPVAINASGVDFKDPDFAERLLRQLDRADLPTSLFEIEVTEGVFLGSDADDVGAALRKLNAAGVRIALDDFGTGYASLTHLKEYPVDAIKIDRSFVNNLTTSPDDRAIVSAMISLSRDLALEVVAEGIETPDQAYLLRDLGCQTGQGFFFSEAVVGSQIPNIMRRIELAGGAVPSSHAQAMR